VFNNSDTPTRLDISENWLFGSYLFNNSHSKPKDWKAKYLKVFGSNKTKGPKEDNQNQLRSAMPKGGKSTVIL
jgi:hypothetical protein